jgi:tRNA threonylcarbamoyladenosine biosynthesis protein TsaE
MLGIRDYFSQDVVALIEWPELGAALLPNSDIVFKFEIKEDERLVQIVANTKKGESILSEMNYF